MFGPGIGLNLSGWSCVAPDVLFVQSEPFMARTRGGGTPIPLAVHRGCRRYGSAALFSSVGNGDTGTS